MKNIYQTLIAIMLTSFLSGGVNYSRDSGVENLWRQPQSFTNDTTTSQQVLRALGPPSQVLAIRKQLAIALIFVVEEIVYLARF